MSTPSKENEREKQACEAGLMSLQPWRQAWAEDRAPRKPAMSSPREQPCSGPSSDPGQLAHGIEPVSSVSHRDSVQMAAICGAGWRV